MGLSLTFNMENGTRVFRKIEKGIEDLSPATSLIATHLAASVQLNFVQGGHPKKWLKSKRAEAEDKKRKGAGDTLRRSDQLMSSITGKVTGVNQVRVGTNVAYAAAHNFGVNKIINERVRSHARRISQAFGKPIDPRDVTVGAFSRQRVMRLPKREFLMIHDTDWDYIADTVSKHIKGLMA